MLTQPIHPIDKKKSRFLIQFHDANNYVVAICPLYVLGIRQIANGTQISVGRHGSSPDYFNVKDGPAEVCERLDAAFDTMESSFVASFLRNDVGAMEDRLATRIEGQLTVMKAVVLQDVKGGLKLLVNETVEHMAASDAVPVEAEKPKKRAG